jgi:hypothetical protein
MRLKGAPMELSQLNASGKDIMAWLNIPPGPEVGRVKQKLLEHAAVFPQDNTPERLEKAARGFAMGEAGKARKRAAKPL